MSLFMHRKDDINQGDSNIFESLNKVGGDNG